MFHGARDVDGALLAGALLKVIVGDQPGLASCVANDNAALLEALNIALVVAADAISYRDKREVVFVEDISTFGS